MTTDATLSVAVFCASMCFIGVLSDDMHVARLGVSGVIAAAVVLVAKMIGGAIGSMCPRRQAAA